MGTGNEELDKAIELAGYSYDPEQDIFYSSMNPWQRNVGYCRLYDEAAAPMGMIIDCEPIYFEYNQKKWMIGFWKGQYDLVTGGEIGIYTAELDFNVLGRSGAFYISATNDERLKMAFVLKKNNKILFARDEKHWWLTGFKLGEFSEPSELTMEIKMNLENAAMRDAFVDGLKKAGYADNEITANGYTVSFTFAAPRTRQPITRTKGTDLLIQKKNKELCDLYHAITGESGTIPEKIKIIQEQAPHLYEKIIRMGKAKHYETFLLLVRIGAFILGNITSDRSKSVLPSVLQSAVLENNI